MTPQRMHADELDIDESLVRKLMVSQFPQWAGLPLRHVESSGTDNALYRLGDDMVVRLPRIHWAVGSVEKDHVWLPLLAPRLPVEIPIPLVVGSPDEGYPWRWSVYRWLEGENPAPSDVSDDVTRDLVGFITAMREVDLSAGPPATRGGPLIGQDEELKVALPLLEGVIDVDAAKAAWHEALAAPEWTDDPVWIHGDLLPGNLLVRDGRLTGVIDWGEAGVGDPSCDMIPAWALLSSESRNRFRDALGIDDATWTRGRGWALSIGLIALPYYAETNPQLAATARRLISEVLGDGKSPFS